MRFEYPYTIAKDEDGFWLAKCPDVRGAATDDRNRATAISELHDALVAALGGYIEKDLPLPVPTAPAVHGQTIALEPLHAAKLALHAAKRAHGLSNSALARQLGVAENTVRRMLDLDQGTQIGTIQAALQKLGRRLVIEEVPAEETEYA
jgi:antitoxin HicB